MEIDRTSFGRYRVVARLGSGGMGLVYLAVALGPAGVQKLVVIKQLRDSLASTASVRGMFLDEARVAMRLNHPNVVQTNEVVDEGPDLYLVMEFLDGQPLATLLESDHAGRLPLAARLRIVCDALTGLHYAHELSDLGGTPLAIVHRDVSPHNIMVTYEGQVKIVDFGIAKAADATTVTDSGVFKGKVRYTSPEQALSKPIDRRADVFGMGIILWECVAGRRLWQDANDASILVALVSGKLPDLVEANPSAPPELVAICKKALAVDPDERYATARDMRAAIVAYQRTLSDTTELGAVVTAGFANERSELRALVDAQIKAMRERTLEADTMRPIPILGSGSATASEGTAMARGGVAVEATPVKPPRVNKMLVLAVAGVVTAAVVAAVATTRSHDDHRGAPASAAPAVPERVHVRLHATPDGARFVLDGTPLPSNPFDGEAPRDSLIHSIVVRADGFDTRNVDTTFDRDVAVDVSLSAIAPPPPPTPPKVVAKPKPFATPVTPPAPKPTRQIDEGDPYRP